MVCRSRWTMSAAAMTERLPADRILHGHWWNWATPPRCRTLLKKYLTTPEFYAKVERPKPTPEEGIGVIQNAGGVAVLAHPHQLKLETDALEAMVVRLKAAGLQGIEAYYSRHTPSQTQFLSASGRKVRFAVHLRL